MKNVAKISFTKSNKIISLILVFLMMFSAAACANTGESGGLPKEVDSVKADDPEKNAQYGNSYRAYTMAEQAIKDFYLYDKDGGRSYNLKDKSVAGDSWNYVALIDMMENLLVLFPDDKKMLDKYENAILGMDYFGSITKRGKWQNKVYCTQPSAKKWQSTGVCSYDDSAHIARMFLDAYEKTGKEEYRIKGQNQIEFLIDDAYIKNENIEAFYWCDTSPIVAPVTNTMLIYDFLRMYSYLSEEDKNKAEDIITLSEKEIDEDYYITTDKEGLKTHKYIYYAQKAYKWSNTLYDPISKCYSLQTTATYENGVYEKGKETGTAGQHPVRDAHTGFMISACVALYEFTGDEAYLDKAIIDANAYFDYFFTFYEIGGVSYYRPMTPNNWLFNKYVRGIYDLSKYRYDQTKNIMSEVNKTMNYAYDNTLIDNYICPTFLTGWLTTETRHQNYWLLDTSAAPTIFTYLRFWQKGIYNDFIKPLK